MQTSMVGEPEYLSTFAAGSWKDQASDTETATATGMVVWQKQSCFAAKMREFGVLRNRSLPDTFESGLLLAGLFGST